MGFFDVITGLYGRIRGLAVATTLDFHMTEGAATTPAVNLSLQALLLLNEKPEDVPATQWSSSIKIQLDRIESYVSTSREEEAFMRPPYTYKKGGYVLIALTAMGLLGLCSAESYGYFIAGHEDVNLRKSRAKIDYRNIRNGNESTGIFSVTNESCSIVPYESVCRLVPCSVYDSFFESCQRQLFYSGDNCTQSMKIRMKISSPLKYSLYEEDCAEWLIYIILMMPFLGALSGFGALAMPFKVLSCYNKAVMTKILSRPVTLLNDEQSLLSTDKFPEKKEESAQVFTIGYAKNTLQLMFAKSKEQLLNNLSARDGCELKTPLIT